MASFKAKLLINEEERTILNVAQSFDQISDITGRPDGKPYGESLYISLESTIDDSFFYHHMFDHSEMISGEIIFYKRDGFSILYKIEFANAYILGLEENFEAHDDAPLHFNIKIGWGIIKINGIVHEEDWNPDNPFESGGEVTTIENLEPDIISLRYLDTEGNEIDELYEDKLFLEIVTENCIGKLVDVDLSDDEFDFSYNGVYLENDLLEDLEITADVQKVELEIYGEDDEETATSEETTTTN